MDSLWFICGLQGEGDILELLQSTLIDDGVTVNPDKLIEHLNIQIIRLGHS